MKVEIYKVDRKMLKQAKKRGYCLCDAVKKNDGSNACPCDEFLNKDICKCRVFKKI